MNFEFVKQFTESEQLYNFCKNSEKYVLDDYNSSVIQARSALEYIVKTIYFTNVETNYDITLFEMMSDSNFINYINDDTYMNSLHYIRKMGNRGAHQGGITEKIALNVLEHLHFVVGEFFIMLGLISDYQQFVAPTKDTQILENSSYEEENRNCNDDNPKLFKKSFPCSLKVLSSKFL